jgi:hypothetical protein
MRRKRRSERPVAELTMLVSRQAGMPADSTTKSIHLVVKHEALVTASTHGSIRTPCAEPQRLPSVRPLRTVAASCLTSYCTSFSGRARDIAGSADREDTSESSGVSTGVGFRSSTSHSNAKALVLQSSRRAGRGHGESVRLDSFAQARLVMAALRLQAHAMPHNLLHDDARGVTLSMVAGSVKSWLSEQLP